MTPQELKNSILQLAIQGKLVEQRPEEGTGRALYEKILEDKGAFCKELSAFEESEVSFDIPDTWTMVRIKNVAILHNGRAYKQNELLENGKYPVLRVGNLFTKSNWYYSDLELESEKYCSNGDLLYSWSASFGPYIWNGDKVIYHYHIWKIDHSEWVDRKYFFYFLLADTDNIKRSGHGLAMIHVTKAGTEERAFPLPPLAEQKRIVAKIEELLPLIDRYEKAWSQLEDFNKRFPADMQKSLLQLAIQGKLVEQRPEEGTGEELYQHIQDEKQKLIKEGKIKKEKPLPEITEDEIPFELPENWRWIRLHELGSFSSGKTPSMSETSYWANGTVSWITSKDMKHKYLSTSEMLISTSAAADMTLYPPRTLLMVVRSGILKRMLPLAILESESTINQDIKAFSLHLPVMVEYVYCMLKGFEPYILKEYRKQVTTVDSLKFDEFKAMPVPLPPLAEQKRIVARLEELLPLCDQLK